MFFEARSSMSISLSATNGTANSTLDYKILKKERFKWFSKLSVSCVAVIVKCLLVVRSDMADWSLTYVNVLVDWGLRSLVR